KNYMLHNPNDVAVDEDGNIYICDGGNQRVQKFDKTGKYVCTIGRRGEGPGEFLHPWSVFINDQDELLVSSYRPTSIFDRNGNFLRNFGKKSGGIFLENNTIARDGHLGLNKNEIEKEIKDIETARRILKKLPLVNILDYNLNTVAKIGRIEIPEDESFTDFYNHYFIAADRDNNYYLTREVRNLVEKYAPDGTLLFKATRPIELKESKEMQTIVSKGVGTYLYNKISNIIKLDGKKRIWVETYRRPYTLEERLKHYNTLEAPDIICYDIFNSDGVFLQRIPWEDGISRRLVHIEGDRMFFISWKYECVYEYKIVKN
ncbi:NHL repeat-containing protein, partial [candidate division KSB1 bacterium]